jgi:serine/threonine protein kinase/TolB-like protein/Flp pilus assembly protein TadD
MDPDRWRAVEALFHQALEREEPARSLFLDGQCAGDLELRHEVDQWLAADARAPAQLAAAVGDAVRSLHTAFAPGTRVGQYEIVSLMGEGGMGSVYRARRSDDVFQKEVAIKVVKRGIDSGDLLRRFRRERQILARLEHPYIARVLDGGSTDDGLPYLVMEYVDGRTVLAYAAEREFDLRSRLRLFLQVCEAVEYAHQSNVVHRDLKPSNILVDKQGRPRLLDFGIAALIAPDPDASVTASGLTMLTPQYASPEQVRGEPVTIASDVYCLGLILYELLTGCAVHAMASLSPGAVVKAVCEGDVAPLAQAAQAARARGSTFPVSPRALNANLDRIVRVAIEKAPARRYASVQALAEDIQRYVESLSNGDVFTTGVQEISDGSRPALLVDGARSHHGLRPRMLVAAGLIVLVTAGYLWSRRPVSSLGESGTGPRTLAVLPFRALDPNTTEDYLAFGMADALITRLAQVNGLIVRPTSSVMKYSRPTVDPLAPGRELAVSSLLDGRFQRVGDRIRVTVQLLDVRDGSSLWAGTFDELFDDVFALEDAISERVAQALVANLTREDRSRLTRRYTENAAAYQLYLRGRYLWERRTSEALKKSVDFYQQAIANDPSYGLAYAGLADAYVIMGNFGLLSPDDAFPKAKAAATKALELDRDLVQAEVAHAFATYLYDRDWNAAETGFRQALAGAPDYGPGHQWYAVCLLSRGRFEEAIAEIRRAQDAEPLSQTIAAVHAWVLYLTRQYEAAIVQANRVVEMDPASPLAHYYLGLSYAAMARFDESTSALRRSTVAIGAEGRDKNLGALGFVLARQGRTSDAHVVIRELQQQARRRYVPPYAEAIVRLALGDREQALTLLERAAEKHYPWAVHFNVDPMLDSLRSDARFSSLLQRVGMPVVALPDSKRRGRP